MQLRVRGVSHVLFLHGGVDERRPVMVTVIAFLVDTDAFRQNQFHALLADKIDWQRFEASFSPLYSADNGRPAKPIRLMCGLLILKHVRNLSDESVVEQWSENAYYQYFCGMLEFTPSFPCNATVTITGRRSSTPPCRKRT